MKHLFKTVYLALCTYLITFALPSNLYSATDAQSPPILAEELNQSLEKLGLVLTKEENMTLEEDALYFDKFYTEDGGFSTMTSFFVNCDKIPPIPRNETNTTRNLSGTCKPTHEDRIKAELERCGLENLIAIDDSPDSICGGGEDTLAELSLQLTISLENARRIVDKAQQLSR